MKHKVLSDRPRQSLCNSLLLSAVLFALGLLALPSAGPAQQTLDDADWFERDLGEGVVWRHYLFDSLFGSMQSVSYIEVDLANPDVAIEFPYVADSREQISTMIPRQAPDAVAGINGTYFNTRTGGHVTYLRVDGEEVPRASPPWAPWIDEGALGMDNGGNAAMVEEPGGGWPAETGYTDLLACGPLLIIDDTIPASDLNSIGGHCSDRHPRSAVGITGDGRLILLTVDGRTEMSAGMTCEELAQVMEDLGCGDALNLDGGGSTTLWGSGEPYSGVLNFPSDNGTFDHEGERACSNAIAIISEPAPPATWDARLTTKSFEPVMTSEGGQTVTLAYKNIGTATWDASDFHLVLARPESRTSVFEDESSWVSATEPAAMEPSTVAPGETATFQFILQAPEVSGTQVYTEHFKLVRDGTGRAGPADSAAWMQITVQQDVEPGEDFIVESRIGGQNFGWYEDEGMANTSADCTAPGTTPGIGTRYGSTFRSVAGSKRATVAPEFPLAGLYRVSVAWGAGSSRRSPITYRVTHAYGTEVLHLDQTATANEWVQLGNGPYYFQQGTGGSVDMTNEDIDTSGAMYAGAVKFEYIQPVTPDKEYKVRSLSMDADPPEVDGIRGPDEWSAAAPMASGFVLHNMPESPATEDGGFQVLSDPSALYILYEMENSYLPGFTPPAAPIAHADLPGDKINFYLAPYGPESDPFYRILLAPNPSDGICYVWTQANSTRTTSPSVGTDWQPSGTAAFTYEDESLTIEYRLPWTEFDHEGMVIASEPEDGSLWGIQPAVSNEVSAGTWEYTNWEPDETPSYILGSPLGGLRFLVPGEMNQWRVR